MNSGMDPIDSPQALREAHHRLLRAHRGGEDSSKLLAEVRSFLERGRGLGEKLPHTQVRWKCQNLLDYWVPIFYRAGSDSPDTSLAPFDASALPSSPPYLGLVAFAEKQSNLFFGRQQFIDHILKRLQKRRLLVITGPSGSGKSSAVRAGLLPSLHQKGLLGSSDWRVLDPFVPGADPIAKLKKSIDVLDKGDGEWQQALAEIPTVIVVDQFEELFTLCHDELKRSEFVHLLAVLTQDSKALHRVVLTLREDYLSLLVELPHLGPLASSGAVEYISRLEPAELREAIVGPAEHFGVGFERGLVDALVQEFHGERTGLPLLQFTLLKLWEEREGSLLTWRAYEKLGRGRQALKNMADELFDVQSPKVQDMIRRVLLRLVRIEEGGEILRHRIRRGDLYSQLRPDLVDRVLRLMGNAGLIVVDREDAWVEVTHEALVRNWPRLTKWVDEVREELLDHQRLAAATENWDAGGRDTSYLWSGLRVDYLLEKEGLTPLEKAFLAASRRWRRTQRFKRWLMVVLALLPILLLFDAWRRNQNSVREALIDERERVAASNRLSSTAVLSLEQNLDLAGLLSLEALRLEDSSISRSAALRLQHSAPEIFRFLGGFSGAVTRIAFDSQGSKLATAGSGGHVLLWNPKTWQRIGRPLKTPDGSSPLAFSSDGLTIAVGSEEDHNIVLWDVGARREIRSLVGHRDLVTSAAFSPDGTKLATGSNDGTVKLWSLEAGESKVLLGSSDTCMDNDSDRDEEQDDSDRDERLDNILSVAFSSQDNLVAAGRMDGCAFLLDSNGERPPRSLSGHQGGVWQMAFDSEGRRVASASLDHTVRLWDSTSGKFLFKLGKEFKFDPDLGHTNRALAVAFDPSGTILATGGKDARIYLWELSSEEPVIKQQLVGHGRAIWSLAFDPNGEVLISGGKDKKAIVWDVDRTQGQERKIPQAGIAYAVGFVDHRRKVAIGLQGGKFLLSGESSIHAGSIHAGIDPAQGKAPAPKGSQAGAVDSRGELVALGREGGSVDLWSPRTGELRSLPAVKAVLLTALEFAPDGRTLAAVGESTSMFVWNLETGHSRQLSDVLGKEAKKGTSIAFHPQQDMVAVGDDRGKVSFRSLSTGDPVMIKVPPTGDPVKTNLPSTEDFVKNLESDLSEVYALAFSPDGSLLAGGGRSYDVQIWSVKLKELEDPSVEPEGLLMESKGPPMEGHRNWVTALAFSPDGRILASGDWSGDLLLWDSEGLARLGARLDARYNVRGLAFSREGKWLVSGSGEDRPDGRSRVVLWEISPEAWNKTICNRSNRNLSCEEWRFYLGDRPYSPTCPRISSGCPPTL